MADGAGPDFLSRSMFFREAEGGPSGQELASMSAPFGGSPEQAMAFLQSPGAQQMLQHFGLSGFDPSQIRQSPFFPNSFMQNHPHLGGGLSSAMANVAATPEAPLVSGAGSGMSRAMQGVMGGNEMQRQYRVRQLMAPFQAMGMQMPAMAEQRRQQLLQSLMEDMKSREALSREGMDEKAREFDLKQQRQREDETVMRGGPKFNQLTGETWLPHPGIPAQPRGPIQPQEQTQAGAGMPAVQGTEGLVSPMAPGTPAQPYQPAGFTKEQADLDRIGNVAERKETDATKTLKGAQANRANAQAAETRYKSTPQYKIATELSKADQFFGHMLEGIDSKYNPLIATVGANTEQGKTLEQQRQNDVASQVANYLVRIQHAQGQITPEQQQWLQQYQMGAGKLPPQVAPNAKTDQQKASPGSAQAGGAGAQTSQGTAIQQPNPQAVW